MNTTKFTFVMLNVVAASVLVANLRLINAPVPGISSGFITATKEPVKEKTTPAVYMDKINLVFPKKEVEEHDVFKKKGDIITFNTNPTPGIVFRVQLLASKEQVPLFSSSFNGLGNVQEEYSNGIYRYTVGEFRKPIESEHLFYNLELKGHNDCYLVAYKDGQRINLKDAVESVKN